MPAIRIALTITTETPLSVGAGGSTGTLAGKSIMRDGLGQPLIPGSQLKGKTRHAAEALARTMGMAVPDHFDSEDDTIIRALFGSPQQRGALRFADLIAEVPLAPTPRLLTQPERALLSPLRPSVSINRRRGVAEDARLVLQETAREGLRYRAERAITGTLNDDQHRALALLWAALRLTTRWGGAKTRGLGWASVQVQVFWGADTPPLEDAVLGDWLQQLPTSWPKGAK